MVSFIKNQHPDMLKEVKSTQHILHSAKCSNYELEAAFLKIKGIFLRPSLSSDQQPASDVSSDVLVFYVFNY